LDSEFLYVLFCAEGEYWCRRYDNRRWIDL